MRYAKMLTLLAVAAAAMMAFAATASATTLTSPSGTTYTSSIHGSSEGATTLHGPVDITCEESTVEGKVEQHGADPITAGGKISKLTFSKCGSNDVTVLKPGSLEIHTDKSGTADGNGTLTSSGASILIHTSLGFDCEYTTSSTDIGTVKGSKNTGGKATLSIDSVSIPRTGGSFFCGSSAEWTGSYVVDSPTYLDVD
jgi:opacity protein-like surface antigen